MTKKFFITGANGWLGKAICESFLNIKLKNDLEVTCLVREGEDVSELNDLGFATIVGDITNRKSIENFLKKADGSTVIHTAGIIHPSGLFNATSKFYEINYLGTKSLYDLSLQAGVNKFVYVSSNSPFGANTLNEFNEQSEYKPYMGYGRSKCMAEKHILSNSTDLMAYTIVRAPWFYGPRQPLRQSEFFSLIKTGKFPIVGNYKNLRSMAYIYNLADGILLSALNKKADNEIFWISDERPYSMAEVIETVQNVLSSDFGFAVQKPSIKLPSIVSDIARCVDYSLQNIGFYNQKIHVLSEMNMNIYCSIEKAKSVLGYKPEISLREGMRRSVAWCLDHGTKI